MASNSINNTSASLLIPRAVINSATLKNKLNVCHINVQSLCARQFSKFEELKMTFCGSNIDIVCMTETWLDDSITDNMIAMNGFNLLRNNRNRHGGGICVYFKNDLKCRVLRNSNNNLNQSRCSTEYFLLECNTGDNRFL